MTRDRSERGGVTLTVAFAMVALLGAASLALDLGLARVGVRDMQAVADLVALDQARLIDGRTEAQLLADANWSKSLAESAARNNDAYPAPTVTAELGKFAASTFTPTAGGDTPDAVKVTAAGTVNYVLRQGDRLVSRSAVAMNDKTACIAVGSYAAQIKSNNSSLLSSLIGDKLGINLLSYTGLLNAEVSLLDLAAAFDVGTVEGLVSKGTVTLSSFYAAVATALTPTDAVTASLINNTLKANVSSLGSINLADLITVGTGAGSALNGKISVLDLLAGSVFLANGSNFVSIPALTANLNPAGLSSTNLTLQDVHIIQKPVANCGKIGTKASNSQIDLTLTGPIASIAIPNPGIALAKVDGTITLKITVALAEGTVKVIDCKQGNLTNPDKVTVDTVTTLLKPSLTLALGVSVKALLVYLPPVPLTVGVTAPTNTATSSVVVNLPPNVQHYDAGQANLSGVTPTISSNSLLPTVLAAITSSITNPITAAVDGLINGSLKNALGVELAGADVFAFPRPSCRSSKLVQ